jgi:quinoprotein dehydrogenase-associated probable ABC transporter substrate-binding protein
MLYAVSTTLLVIAGVAGSTASAAPSQKAFKVCADPHYAPFSTKEQQGFENKIAEILAADLSLPIKYTWFPQRMGFIRNTLRAQDPAGDGYRCDIVMGVPDDFELAITTDSYYRSTYALVYLEGRGLDDIQSPEDLVNLDDARKTKLHIGLTERSPGTLWLAKYNMFEQMVPYVAQSGDPNEFPGESIERDLLNGRIDTAILWGPTAGYVKSRNQDKKIRIVALKSEPGVKFDYSISAGVRFGEKEWRNRVNSLLKSNSGKIRKILEEYNIPLVVEEQKNERQ